MSFVSLVLEEQTEKVHNLINLGKNRGYLLYGEVNDILPADVQSEEIDSVMRLAAPGG